MSKIFTTKWTKFFLFFLLTIGNYLIAFSQNCTVPACPNSILIDNFTTVTPTPPSAYPFLYISKWQNLLTAFESTNAPEALCGRRDVYIVSDPDDGMGGGNLVGVAGGALYNDEGATGNASYYITYDGTNGSTNETPDATVGLGGINLSGRQFKFDMFHDINPGEGYVDFYVRVWSSPSQMSYTKVSIDHTINYATIAFPTTMTPVLGGGADMSSIRAIQIFVDTKGYPSGALDFEIDNFVADCVGCVSPNAATPIVSQATCNANGTANNDAYIQINPISSATHYAYTTNGSDPSFSSAVAVSGNSITLLNLPNPSSATTYRFRLFNNSATCYTDVAAVLNPKSCTPSCVLPNAATPIVSQATCNANGTVNNDAYIQINPISSATHYAYTTNGADPSFSSAVAVSGNSITLLNLPNPSSATTYRFRLFNNSATCYTDVAAVLNPKSCTPSCVLPNAATPIVSQATCNANGSANNDAYIQINPISSATHYAYTTNGADPNFSSATALSGNSITLLNLPNPSSATTYRFRLFNNSATCYTDVSAVLNPKSCTPSCVLPNAATPIVSQATCNANGTANNDAYIQINPISSATHYAYTTNGSDPSFSSATALSGNSITLLNLPNPASATTYRFRLFNNSATCYTDVSAVLNPKSCTPSCVLPNAATPIVSQATCNANGTANNDAYIQINPISSATHYAYTTNGADPSFSSATALSGNSITLLNLPNPSSATTYRFRLFNNSATCYTDVSAVLNPKSCTPSCVLPNAATPIVSQATCNANGTANNDAYIQINPISSATHYAYTTNGADPSFSSATAFSGNSITLLNLPNPASATTYRFRLFNNSATCYTDVAAVLNPKSCTPSCVLPNAATPIVSQATCNANGTANNDAYIQINPISSATHYAYTTNGADPSFSSATAFSGNSITLLNLPNPSSATTYRFRLFNNSATCYTDVSAVLNPKSCTPSCVLPNATTPIVSQATCNANGSANNDAYIQINPISSATHYAYTTNGADPSFSSATAFSGNSITLLNLPNPSSATTYRFRLFNNSATCYTDVSAVLNPKSCTPSCVLPNATTPIVSQATCNANGSANNDAYIQINPISSATHYAYTTNGADPSFSSATALSGNSITLLNLPNPSSATTYRFRLFNNSATCYTDVAAVLNPKSCTPSCVLPNVVTPVVNQASCNTNGTANDDASIIISTVSSATHYAYTTNGTEPNFTLANPISNNSISLLNLSNPTSETTYRIRIFNNLSTCFYDVYATLSPKTCEPACTYPSVGNDREICLPRTSLTLNAAPDGYEWATENNLPIATTINRLTGAISGMTSSGVYKYRLQKIGNSACSNILQVIVKPENTPIELCNNTSNYYTIFAPSTFSNVIWYNSSGQQVGTGNSLQITSSTLGLADGIESYYYKSSSDDECNGESCCPVTIKTKFCCPTPNCINIQILKNP